MSTKPGLYPNVPADEYHGIDACSSTRLSWIVRSPAYCRSLIDHPRPPTDAQAFGKAAHYAVLEPDKVETVYIAAEQCSAETGSGRRCKNTGSIYRDGRWWCRMRGHAPIRTDDDGPEPEQTAIGREDLDRALRVRDSVYANECAYTILRPSVSREVSLFWTGGGIACKGRPDLYHDDGLLCDLKITRDAHPSRMPLFVARYGVHRQLALYLEGLRALGRKVAAPFVIAVEPEPPHEVCVYELHEDALRAGAEHARKLREQYRACLESGVWPGYPVEPQDLMVPGWVMREQFPEEFAYGGLRFDDLEVETDGN